MNVCDNLDISVIIPVYNSEKTIIICFESVYEDLKYSGYTYEIILINDGSKDNSLKLLLELKEKYDNIVIINQENSGPSSARNAGLRIAKGNYIAFCDSDDRWIKGKTAFSMKILSIYPDIKCLSGKYIGKEKDININEYININNIISIRIKNISLGMQLFKNYFNPQASILSRELIKENIYFNTHMKYSEDRDFFNRIVSKYHSSIIDVVFTKSIIGKFVYGESGLSSNLYEMEKGELHSFFIAYKTLRINFFIYLFACIFSIIKYFRRCLIVFFRKYIKLISKILI
jgi:glycosyltransferase involved in cell wall biosynthesis